jgi:hypothetical protein
MQPFDNGPFDKRFEDTYKPAIEECGLVAYRVDKDINANNLDKAIIEGIKNAAMCFVDISLDNPNVWYELGYAMAYSKEIIMICLETARNGKFPFDVQNYKIITYNTVSSSDFDKLKDDIQNKIKANKTKNTKIASITSPLKEIEGLDTNEITALVAIASNIDSPEDNIGAWSIKQEMKKAGYTDIACTLALRKLSAINFLVFTKANDGYQNGEYVAYTITDKGLQWLENNKAKLVLKTSNDCNPSTSFTEDIPF